MSERIELICNKFNTNNNNENVKPNQTYNYVFVPLKKEISFNKYNDKMINRHFLFDFTLNLQ